MKLIVVTSRAPLRFTVIPDSALAFNRRPWFVPDEGRGWTLTPARAWRIGRLGKSIGREYARRYVDATTRVLLAGADGIEAERVAAMDGAAIIGDWIPLSPDATADDSLAETIAEISRLTTFKTGDIIIPEIDPSLRIPAKIDTRLNETIDGTECLSIKIK